MRGSSGATITETRCAVKTGSARVVEQGLWLQRVNELVLPRVYKVHYDGYSMEWLTDPPYDVMDHQLLLQRVFGALEHLWRRPPEVKLDLEAHRSRLYELIPAKSDPQGGHAYVLDDLQRLRNRITWVGLRAGLTHGDPTLDNVMLRGSDVVLIDPIPATPAVPDLRAVDTGNLLQSILGFEALRYADTTCLWRLEPSHLRALVGDDVNEWLATVYWCVVKLLRVIPYMTSDVVRAELWGMIDRAFRLV